MGFTSWGGMTTGMLQGYASKGIRYAQEEITKRQGATTQSTTQVAPATGSSLPGAARGAFQKAMAQYEPGGGFGKGTEAALERGRTKALASGTQSLVSAGLAGTSVVAGLGKKFEEEVAMPTRAGVEQERAQRISQLQAALAAAEQRGYETAEDRALRSELANLQASTQRGIAGAGAETARAGLASQERMATQDVEMQKYIAEQKYASQERTAKTQFGGSASTYGRGHYGGQTGGQTGGGAAVSSPVMDWADASFGASPEWRQKYTGYRG